MCSRNCHRAASLRANPGHRQRGQRDSDSRLRRETNVPNADDGVLLIRKFNGAYQTDHVVLFDEVIEIVPMGDDAAIVLTKNGSVMHLGDLDEQNYSVAVFQGLQHSFESKMTVVSPSVVLSTRGTPTSTTVLGDDLVQLWRIPAAFGYGSASPNPGSHALEAVFESRRPSLSAGLHWLGLRDAPPLATAYLTLSFGRASVFPAFDAEILVDLEEQIALHYWIVYPDGNTRYRWMSPTIRTSWAR